MTNAIIYARYSDPSQGKGSSIARQLEGGRTVAAAKGWIVETERADGGKSAYTGKNRMDGAALADIEAEAQEGLHSGKILIVEKMDRLSRQGYEATLSLINGLRDNGVSIATHEGAFYRAGERLGLAQLVEILVRAELAYDESHTKAKRVRKGKADARKAARDTGRIFTAMAPPWLEIVGKGDDRHWKVNPSRLTIVKMIFQMADEGAGKMTIARHLNSIDPVGWGKGKRAGKGWHPSMVVRILSNRAVLGEYQPHTFQDGKRVPEGEPIQGYYPVIIDADLFERVNAQAGARKAVSGGRKGAERVGNLVSGLAKCAHCGASMRYRVRAAEGVIRRVNGKEYVKPHADASLVCSRADRGVESRCSNRSGIAYHTFEKALLDNILHLALDDQAFSNRGEVGRLNKTIAERRRDLELITGRAETLWGAYADDPSAMAAKLAREAEAKAKDIRENVEALKRQREQAKGRASSAEHLRRVADIRANLYHADMGVRLPLRRKVAQGFQSVISSISCDANRVATVTMAGGLVAFKIERGKVEDLDRGDFMAAVIRGQFNLSRKGYDDPARKAVMGRLEKAKGRAA